MAAIEIYALRHPVTKEIRYIGKANNSTNRLKGHLRDCRTRKTPVYDWINKLLSEGIVPVIEVLCITDENNWKQTEIEIISKYRNNGTRLLNVALGGDEPFCSKEQRAINGRKNALLIHANPQRKRLWEIRHQFACCMRWLKKNGRVEKYNQISVRLIASGINHSLGLM